MTKQAISDLQNLEHNAEQAVTMLKMLANKHRLMLLCLLQAGEQSVSQLNQQVVIPQSTLSQHLAFLRQTNLVSTRRQGQTIFYALKDPNVTPIIAVLQQLYCP